MGQQNRLIRRGGVWTFRVRVPDKLRSVVGKREIWKSLGGVSHAEAARLARIESVRVDSLFAEAERRLTESGARPLDAVTDAELERLARSYFFQLESEAAPVPFSEGQR
jgi:hypothetical protein